jgi:hypothetical protein
LAHTKLAKDRFRGELSITRVEFMSGIRSNPDENNVTRRLSLGL